MGLLIIASTSRWLYFFATCEEVSWALIGREVIVQFPLLGLSWVTGSAWVLWKARQVGPKEEQPRRERKGDFRQAA
ncbi:MAG: hypothetical protein WEC84_03385 [Candidatus Andersenbacteria bacterium]